MLNHRLAVVTVVVLLGPPALARQDEAAAKKSSGQTIDLSGPPVKTEAVDYRYARREGFDVDMEPAELPPPVAAACLRLARRLGLLLAGIDLKVTPEGEYYCFEVNPSPAFLYYEQATLQPISEAIAELLHFGPSTAAPDHEDAPAAGVGVSLA